MTAELETADPAASAAAALQVLRLQRVLVGSLLDTTEALANAVPLDTDTLGWSGAAQRQYGRALRELGGLLLSVSARLAGAKSDLDRAIASGDLVG